MAGGNPDCAFFLLSSQGIDMFYLELILRGPALTDLVSSYPFLHFFKALLFISGSLAWSCVVQITESLVATKLCITLHIKRHP